ncbi:UDP-N-acetylmuramoyl-tripeptide--D-alanyl-D-alanine ligase [Mycoplasmatota bacterium zrk1]
MKKFSLDEFNEIIGGEIAQDNFLGDIEYVGYRVRFLDVNSAYFYVSNSRIYPSDFNGTNIVIVSDVKLESEFDDFTIIYVDDVDQALEKFVKYYRSLFDIPVVGVTGTCGKTTTKEMIKFILSKFYNVEGTISSKNAGYFNLPYLVALDDYIDVAVYEMGVAEPNDILEANMYFNPNIGIITNIGYDHFNGCKDLDGYIKAKAEMLEIIDESGFVILNKDCENTAKIDISDFEGKLIYFGKNESEYRITDVDVLRMSYTLIHDDKKYIVKLPGLGEHNMYNATAAIIACRLLGIDITESIAILKDYKYVSKHLELKSGINGSLIIDDSFSSNPTSLKAAIDVLMEFPKKKIIILSKMGYLDDLEEELHREMGQYLTDVDYLITLDEVSKLIGYGAIENGLEEDRVIMLDSVEGVKELLSELVDEDTVVLVKISMLDNFEEIFDYLVDENLYI